MSPDSRPEAAPDDVARWCEAVKAMPADELAEFERQTRRAYQRHSLIDLIRAIVVRRAELERGRWFRIKPPTKNPQAGF